MRGLFIGIAAALFSLAGCATEAQRIALSIRTQSAEAAATAKSCLAEIASDPHGTSASRSTSLSMELP